MTVAIAGAHGKIGLRLARLLAAGGEEVVGLVRNPDHVSVLDGVGARGVVCDLEQATVDEVSAAVAGCDAVVFAAGAGPGSGPERKWTMDRDGAIKLLHASEDARARYLMISSVGAEDPPAGDDVFSVYLRAKAEADAALMASDREWTIVRPGPLTDDPGTGRVRLATDPFRDAIPRDDVAALLAAVLGSGQAARMVLYAAGGATPIGEALAALSA
jgi:nucleoside-diphosphate-sugar epimerase